MEEHWQSTKVGTERDHMTEKLQNRLQYGTPFSYLKLSAKAIVIVRAAVHPFIPYIVISLLVRVQPINH